MNDAGQPSISAGLSFDPQAIPKPAAQIALHAIGLSYNEDYYIRAAATHQ